MFDSDINRQDAAPLHRLIKRSEAQKLLQEFRALLPGLELALIGVDGNFFVHTAGRAQTALADPAQWAALLAQARAGQAVQTADFLLYPLLFESRLLGVVALFGLPQSSQQALSLEQVLRCVQQSLAALLVQALEKRELVRETLERYREINLLYDAGETIGASLDTTEICRLVLAEARRAIRADTGVVSLLQADQADEFEISASLGLASQSGDIDPLTRQFMQQVQQTGRPDIRASTAPVQPTAWASALCAPLKVHDQVLGVVLLGRGEGQPIFTAGDEKLVMALAHQAAIALERTRLYEQEIQQQRLEKELAVGRQIQLSLLPKSTPVIPGWEFSTLYQPARQVGGDLYDFFELPGEPSRLGLLIADVTGKGVPAALFMTLSRTIVRSEAMTARHPAEVLERTNQAIIRDSRSPLFLSAFYAVLDPSSGQLTYANGGHNWPLWLQHSTGECQELVTRSTILGAFKSIKLEEREVNLNPGDLLVFYTDGLTEARNPAGHMFGEERLRTVIAGHLHASAEQVQHAVVDALGGFSGNAPQTDDFTLLVVKHQK